MAFVPHSSFVSRYRGSSFVQVQTCVRRNPTGFQVVASGVTSADGMEFFRHREGRWESWRVTHHLAFKRSESGESEIKMEVLGKDDERIVSLCKDWEVDPQLAQGGCYVTWMATMAWDQEGENHEGSTVFALIPDENDVRKGRILRDRGYAEIVPIAGTYRLDEEDDLLLETPYDGGAVEERFAFDGPDVVNRISTVRRFGGFSTATFATERRVGSEPPGKFEDEEFEDVFDMVESLMLHGPGPSDEGEVRDATEAEMSQLKSAFAGRPRFGAGPRRWGTSNSNAPPSANSAFGSGFSAGVPTRSEKPEESGNATTRNGANGGISDEISEAAQKAGIDLTKVPPSMRDDFVASFNADKKKAL